MKYIFYVRIDRQPLPSLSTICRYMCMNELLPNTERTRGEKKRLLNKMRKKNTQPSLAIAKKGHTYMHAIFLKRQFSIFFTSSININTDACSSSVQMNGVLLYRRSKWAIFILLFFHAIGWRKRIHMYSFEIEVDEEEPEKAHPKKIQYKYWNNIQMCRFSIVISCIIILGKFYKIILILYIYIHISQRKMEVE